MVLVPEIGVLALALWCLALALAAAVLVDVLINAMGGVPVLGRVIKAVLSPVVHALSWAAGKLERGIDALIGATWHALARMTDWLWNQWVQFSAVIAQIAHIVGHAVYVNTGLQSLVYRLQRLYHGIEHGVRDLIRKWHGIEHRVKALERTIARGIGHDLRLHIKALERALNEVRTKVIPGIRSDVATAEAEIGHLYDWIKDRANIIGVGTFSFAVATALSTLGLDWIKCREAKNLYNKRGCNMWSDLEALLAGAIGALVLTDFETLIREAQGLEDEAVTLIKDGFHLP